MACRYYFMTLRYRNAKMQSTPYVNSLVWLALEVEQSVACAAKPRSTGVRREEAHDLVRHFKRKALPEHPPRVEVRTARVRAQRRVLLATRGGHAPYTDLLRLKRHGGRGMCAVAPIDLPRGGGAG